ncbi:MAG: phosphotransferase family protein [Pseudomonadales bacterium]|nr:phosphotransferase family protein [Pseudomonadales bacterium]
MPEGINAVRVSEWLTENISGFQGPVSFELLAGGRSNLTYSCVDANDFQFVLRRPPLGHVLQSAHDVAREHRIISALYAGDVPVPRTLGLCEDPEVNDAPFCIFEFVPGDVLHTAEDAQLLPTEHRLPLGHQVAEVLARLHRIDPDEVGLGTLGRKEDYLKRQLKRWSGQWEATKTHPIPAMEASTRLLSERMPEQVGAGIVHGDYRLGNMLVKNGQIQAVLDWELCTLGDPLADLGYLLNSWPETLDESLALCDQPATAVGGFPKQSELCEIYQFRTGRDLRYISYYQAFSHWRLAAIGQGVYKRYLVGAMGDSEDLDLAQYKNSVTERAEAALTLLE